MLNFCGQQMALWFSRRNASPPHTILGCTLLKCNYCVFSRSLTWKDTAVMNLISSVNSNGGTKCSFQPFKALPGTQNCPSDYLMIK